MESSTAGLTAPVGDDQPVEDDRVPVQRRRVHRSLPSASSGTDLHGLPVSGLPEARSRSFAWRWRGCEHDRSAGPRRAPRPSCVLSRCRPIPIHRVTSSVAGCSRRWISPEGRTRWHAPVGASRRWGSRRRVSPARLRRGPRKLSLPDRAHRPHVDHRPRRDLSARYPARRPGRRGDQGHRRHVHVRRSGRGRCEARHQAVTVSRLVATTKT